MYTKDFDRNISPSLLTNTAILSQVCVAYNPTARELTNLQGDGREAQANTHI
jgi:hypothetical protein